MGARYSKNYVDSKLVYACAVLDSVQRTNFHVDYSMVTRNLLEIRLQFLALPLSDLSDAGKEDIRNMIKIISEKCSFLSGLHTVHSNVYFAHCTAVKALFQASQKMRKYL